MAKLYDVFATVMTEDLNNIPPDGIWATVEYPTLNLLDNYGRVDYIAATDFEAKTTKTL